LQRSTRSCGETGASDSTVISPRPPPHFRRQSARKCREVTLHWGSGRGRVTWGTPLPAFGSSPLLPAKCPLRRVPIPLGTQPVFGVAHASSPRTSRRGHGQWGWDN